MTLSLPLVDVSDLVGHLDDPDLRIVDCRWSLTDPGYGKRMYEKCHVPGATHLSVDTDLSAHEGPGRHPLPSPTSFAATVGALGIGPDHTVVAYDDAGGGPAARLWWMLRGLRFPRIGILDGGWKAWTAAAAPVTTDVPAHGPVAVPSPESWPGTIDRPTLESRLGTVHLVDARAPERYRGDIEPIDPVAGHIPTAINLPTTDLIDTDDRFLPPDALASRIGDPTLPTVVYCGSGVTACHDIFAMHLIGHDATLYPGSWSDWSTSGGPIAT